MSVSTPISSTSGAAPWPNVFSIAVYYNEMLSQMWDHPDFPDGAGLTEYLDAVYADALLLAGTAYATDEVSRIWPVYDEPLDGLWPETTTPLLLLQGRLDPATAWAQAQSVVGHFTAPHQTLVDFPYSAHGVPFNSPTPDGDCGVELLRAFLDDPTAPLDLSCRDATLPPDFDDPDMARRVFGVDDPWGD